MTTSIAKGRKTMPFYERGQVRIHYEDLGSGFPLLVIPGGGLNSTVAGLATHPFNPFDEFKGEFRVIAADLRNAKGGQSSGPFEVDRPWDAYAVAMETVHLAPNAQVSLYPWKDTPDKIPLAVRHIRTFLRAHRPVTAALSMAAAAQ